MEYKDREIVNELEHHKRYICALQKTKKKGKGQKQYGGYMVIGGVKKHERAKEEVALTIHKRFLHSFRERIYVSSRILSIRLETKDQMLHISVYAPEDNQSKKEGTY